jgi:hypothetical protein
MQQQTAPRCCHTSFLSFKELGSAKKKKKNIHKNIRQCALHGKKQAPSEGHILEGAAILGAPVHDPVAVLADRNNAVDFAVGSGIAVEHIRDLRASSGEAAVALSVHDYNTFLAHGVKVCALLVTESKH